MSSQLISIASCEPDLRSFLCVGPGLRPFCVWDRVSDPVLRVEEPQPHHHPSATPSSTPAGIVHPDFLRISFNELTTHIYCLCRVGPPTFSCVGPGLRPFCVWDRVSDLFVCGTGSPTLLCVGPGLRPGLAGRRPAATQSSPAAGIVHPDFLRISFNELTTHIYCLV